MGGQMDIAFTVFKVSELTESDDSQKLEEGLIRVINRGYDKPRFKYNLIKTPRIKVGLVRDLKLTDTRESYLGVVYVKTHEGVENGHDASSLTSQFMALGQFDLAHIKPTGTFFELSETLLKEYETGKTCILGTIGIKPYKSVASSYELTAFTSFYPRLGEVLINQIESLAKKLGAKNIFASVITDHFLVDYYAKHDYIVETRVLCKVDPQTGFVISDDLEDSIEASKDFELALLRKTLV
ncbi:unnamed protein product [Kuraishia capsulata CBS 1993]|uniref:N-acetyltransferase domain-containing protein n=1 Tax=Kuraishia capsulata CBS 1993 TaxID=1382522 RepID=W6MRH1_9ASCO|nr:uncharacterized protein KUCA_T00000397001 [Kuraishia capsulata CBS 1993]CDK24435.1 unnamed protein product [Kuraishia capsulata CBS 1993]